MSAREKAVEVLALHLWRKQFGGHHEKAYEPYFQNTRDMLAALHAADLVILDRETVKLAVRWGEFVEDYGGDTAWTMTYDAPALKQMQEALGDADA